MTLLLGFLLSPLLSAAPFKPQNIPATAQWYLHGDLESLRETESGTTVLNAIREDHGEKVAEVRKVLHFDLLSDLTDVTLFGDGEMNHAAIVLEGDVERLHLEKVILKADDYSASTHGEATIHQWQDKGKTQFAALHGDHTIIFSEQKNLVELALDVFNGTKAGLAEAPAVALGNPLILGVAHIHKIDLPKDEGSKIIRMAQTVEMAITEKSERLHARLIVDAQSEEIARHFKDALAGLIAIGSLADEDIAALGIEHEGSAQGKTMDMSMSISVSKALALLSQFQ
ncbi:hypothetical protein V2O64_21110 [Verrucomicrobiaceae bacterium 227]